VSAIRPFMPKLMSGMLTVVDKVSIIPINNQKKIWNTCVRVVKPNVMILWSIWERCINLQMGLSNYN